MVEEVQPKDDLRGRLLKFTFRDHEPGVYGDVTNLETGEHVSRICGIRLDIDMRRLPEHYIQARVLVRSQTERMRPIMVEVPVVFVQDFSLTVRLDPDHDIRTVDHEVLGELYSDEDWERWKQLNQDILEAINKIGTVDDEDETGTQEEVKENTNE
jgi:hypothetical protein